MQNVKQASPMPSSDYKHHDKFIEPGENFSAGASDLKWYDIADASTPVSDEIRDLAKRFLERESTAGKLDELGKLGFVILHRCGAEFYFLLVNSWRNDNELWESVYAKHSDMHADFEEFTLNGPHRGTFCVWELAAVWHEQQAWKKFLLSSRDERAKAIYLQDRYRGPA